MANSDVSLVLDRDVCYRALRTRRNLISHSIRRS